MPFEYKKGHVVNVAFPNDDPNNPGLKDRPCIILDVLPNNIFRFICITSTDWSSSKKGILVDEKSKNFRLMRLTNTSFVNLESIKDLPGTLIRSYRGVCVFMDDIENLLSKK
jgi:hypothetical protein